ncbi:MAG: zinc ABC transporter substrate-binding protein [Candidatus Omnitrophica bacterium]|nr:zinc ABC transporter substrate-binding protein [Candidatus Omnitrophota bacterium]
MLSRCIILLIAALLTSVLFVSAAVLDSQQRPVKIVTSFYPLYIMAINVVKDSPGVRVKNLTSSTAGCLHDYSLSAADMKKIADADILIANGAGMESFLSRITGQYPRLKVITLSDGIPLIKAPGQSGDNPHIWVSISGAIAEVNRLGVELAKADPGRAAIYAKNTQVYVSALESLQIKMHFALLPFKGQKIITFHEAFPYFAQEFGFKIAAVIEREPGSNPSGRDIADTIDLVKKTGIPALFIEPQYPALAAATISRETGARLYTLDPAVTGPMTADAYIQIMEKNLQVMKQALQAEVQ